MANLIYVLINAFKASLGNETKVLFINTKLWGLMVMELKPSIICAALFLALVRIGNSYLMSTKFFVSNQINITRLFVI